MNKRTLSLVTFCGIILLQCLLIHCEHDDPIDDPGEDVIDDDSASENENFKPVDFENPLPSGYAYLAEPFDSKDAIGKKWIMSSAKKEGVDEDISKYDGEWSIEEPMKIVLKNDYGLVLKQKAKHHAISVKLDSPFRFTDNKPLVVQFDVLFQDGQECGGAYIKLLSDTPQNDDLTQFHDKSAYTIMFGPDKCGLTNKLHAIYRFKNPLSGVTNEHHSKQPSKSIDGIFSDKKSHLLTLVLNPDGSYKVLLDQNEISKGSLTTTLEPTIQPDEEINDPDDKKPEDWDEREKIKDETATKPEDWDENEPEQIDDPSAKIPDGWLENEEEYVPDETATKPEDWDPSMDGEWEPPLTKNPKCDDAAGCGAWTVPKVKNPKYKGKWRAPMLKNPDYKGKWSPQKIKNPAWFDEPEPFSKLETITAVGLELWSMSADIMFDNFIITDDINVANIYATQSWYLKKSAENKAANPYFDDSADFDEQEKQESIFGRLIEHANEKPWMWGVYVLVCLVPVVLVAFCCIRLCRDSPLDDEAAAKKTDAVSPDDPLLEDDEQMEENVPDLVETVNVSLKTSDGVDQRGAGDSPTEKGVTAADAKKTKKSDLEESEEEDDDEEQSSTPDDKSPSASPELRRTSPRRRSARKDT